jgi:superfamily II DNA/RNA helicase
MPFDELGLSDEILKAVSDAGYTEPTPIQRHAIPKVLQGRDILGCAQTGTGKTAGFTLPMIDILAHGRARARMPRSLILEPTRELAAQVSENFETYGRYHKLTKALLIGGVSFEPQKQLIDRGVDVLIATPGRLLDHFERGGLLLRGVEILVIDESDRMLDMGFIPDVERIVQLTNPKRQTLFFSATMPAEIKRLADKFLNDPAEIEVAPPASPAETVDQHLSIVDKADKRSALRSLLQTQPVKNALVFCNRKRDVDTVAKYLSGHGFNASALHGDMNQSHRTQTLERFRGGEITILVCSDVAARGLDIQGLSHVFLFDMPTHAEDYVHRIGRTGRAGMPGRSFALAAREDGKYIAGVENLIGKKIPRFEVPEVTTREAEEDAGDGRRRGRGRSRSEKPAAKKPESRKPAAEKAEATKPAPVKPAPVKPDDINPDKAEPEAAKPAARGAAKSAPKTRARGDAKGDKPVVGLGDHVPAFMLREVKLPPKK